MNRSCFQYLRGGWILVLLTSLLPLHASVLARLRNPSDSPITLQAHLDGGLARPVEIPPLGFHDFESFLTAEPAHGHEPVCHDCIYYLHLTGDPDNLEEGFPLVFLHRFSQGRWVGTLKALPGAGRPAVHLEPVGMEDGIPVYEFAGIERSLPPGPPEPHFEGLDWEDAPEIGVLPGPFAFSLAETPCPSRMGLGRFAPGPAGKVAPLGHRSGHPAPIPSRPAVPASVDSAPGPRFSRSTTPSPAPQSGSGLPGAADPGAAGRGYALAGAILPARPLFDQNPPDSELAEGQCDGCQLRFAFYKSHRLVGCPGCHKILDVKSTLTEPANTRDGAGSGGSAAPAQMALSPGDRRGVKRPPSPTPDEAGRGPRARLDAQSGSGAGYALVPFSLPAAANAMETSDAPLPQGVFHPQPGTPDLAAQNALLQQQLALQNLILKNTLSVFSGTPLNPVDFALMLHGLSGIPGQTSSLAGGLPWTGPALGLPLDPAFQAPQSLGYPDGGPAMPAPATG